MNKIPHWNLSFVQEGVNITCSLNGLILCYLCYLVGGKKKPAEIHINVSEVSVLID